MQKVGIVFGVVVIGLAVALGIRIIPTLQKQNQPQTLQTDQELQDFNEAKMLLGSSKPEEALGIIHRYKEEIESLSHNGIQWLKLFIIGAEQEKNIPQLIILFEFFPEIFKEHESSSLFVADNYINQNKIKDYTKIRSLWKDRETKVASWFFLDIDKLLLEGRRTEAIETLKSHTLNDKADMGRLVRLALLNNEDPKTAWEYLREAYAKNPRNPEIRSFRAKLLESVGKYNQAHKEYQASVRLEAGNLFFKDQLAEFYLRQKQYPLAMKTWKEHLLPPSLDKFWIKSLFWSKVSSPVDVDWQNTPIPQGRLKPLIEYLINLEPGEFWNHREFNHLSNASDYFKNQQETFWLKLLHALKLRKEREALHLLTFNPFITTSWFPELETALKRILTYRKSGTFLFENPLRHLEKISTNHPSSQSPPQPPFFKQIEQLAAKEIEEGSTDYLSQEWKELLSSKEAFTAAFLAADWEEAALQLHSLPIIPHTFPRWIPYQLTQAIHHNRSLLEALEFASLHTSTPELSLLRAELIITAGNTDSALESLNTLAALDSDVGFRAAWLTSLLYIEEKKYDRARSTIYAQPRLVQEILGQETLARIALLEGDFSLADTLYSAIVQKSSEARSYLARKAFSEKDWKRARALTEQLILEHPDNAMLKENLQKILAEEDRLMQTYR
ncbi:MAG: hypothetical protein WB791_04055 [Waddliaceae bacterium]